MKTLHPFIQDLEECRAQFCHRNSRTSRYLDFIPVWFQAKCRAVFVLLYSEQLPDQYSLRAISFPFERVTGKNWYPKTRVTAGHKRFSGLDGACRWELDTPSLVKFFSLGEVGKGLALFHRAVRTTSRSSNDLIGTCT